MKFKKTTFNNFKRFTDLTVEVTSKNPRLVILAGPNGCGKSSFFDGLSLWHNADSGRYPSGDLITIIRLVHSQLIIGLIKSRLSFMNLIQLKKKRRDFISGLHIEMILSFDLKNYADLKILLMR